MTAYRSGAMWCVGVSALLLLMVSSVAPTTFTVLCGHTDGFWEIQSFFPQNLTIQAGDDIIFSFQTGHTVSFAPTAQFFPPLFNGPDLVFNEFYTPIPTDASDKTGITVTSPTNIYSTGIQFPPQQWKFSFPNTGTFTFFCLLHPPYMTGTVTVISGKPPKSPQQVKQEGDKQREELFSALKKIEKTQNLNLKVPPSYPSPSGKGTTWVVRIGGGLPASAGSWVGFVPAVFNITVGDTVNFEIEFEVHTLGFNSSGVFNYADITSKGGVVSGNPNYFIPHGKPSHYSGGFTSAGLIAPAFLNIPGTVTGFNVTFTAPGQYPYICHLHISLGMQGQINVLPKVSASPSPSPSGASVVRSSLLALLGLLW